MLWKVSRLEKEDPELWESCFYQKYAGQYLIEKWVQWKKNHSLVRKVSTVKKKSFSG